MTLANHGLSPADLVEIVAAALSVGAQPNWVWKASRSATGTWRRRCPRGRASAWRAWCSWSSEAHRMVKTNVRCAGASDPGRIRSNNEDAFHMDAERGIFLVVDGIGGQAAGEKAAAIAVERVRARLERQTGSAEQRVREAIAMANNEILRAARANQEFAGMACVLTVAVLENGTAVVGHVGDSRLYEVHGGEIRKITHDHSPVGVREDHGDLTELDAMHHPRRNEVFRDVGSEEHSPGDADFIEVQSFPFDAGSALVLCSDGLSDQVGSAEIRAAVERHAGNPAGAVQELIAAANRAGGKDNVTVLVVEGEQFTAPTALVALAPRSPWISRVLLFAAGFVVAGICRGRGRISVLLRRLRHNCGGGYQKQGEKKIFHSSSVSGF